MARHFKGACWGFWGNCCLASTPVNSPEFRDDLAGVPGRRSNSGPLDTSGLRTTLLADLPSLRVNARMREGFQVSETLVCGDQREVALELSAT